MPMSVGLHEPEQSPPLSPMDSAIASSGHPQRTAFEREPDAENADLEATPGEVRIRGPTLPKAVELAAATASPRSWSPPLPPLRMPSSQPAPSNFEGPSTGKDKLRPGALWFFAVYKLNGGPAGGLIEVVGVV